MSKLRPCPFCGKGHRHLEVISSDVPDFYFEFVFCKSCQFGGPVSNDDEPGGGIKLWNNRPVEDAEIARLKARVAELERGAAYWSPHDEWGERTKTVPEEVYNINNDPLFPLEVRCVYHSTVWLVLERVPNGDDDGDEADWEVRWHRFPTEEEAEAFCEKMRAEKGEGEDG